MDLTEEEKGALYDAHLYSFVPPPVSHRLWNRDDWMRYIDSKGVWNAHLGRLYGVIK